MIKRFLPLILIFVSSLCAEEDPDPSDIQASQEKVIDKRENYFRTSTDYAIHPNVNPITGELNEEEIDLVVAGSQPLSIRRFYNHFSPYDPRCASWRYNPEAFLAANLEWKEQETFIAVGDTDGSLISLKRSPSAYYHFNYEVPKNFSRFQPDGKTHPLNTHIHYGKIYDPKDKHRFQYIGTITDGSGRSRDFLTSRHRWIHNISWRDKKNKWWKGAGYIGRVQIRPNTWTPYHIPITEERLPNGNLLIYSYTLWQEEEDGYPYPQLLSSITAYNHDKTKILGSIQLDYPRKKYGHVAGIQISGSDGRSAFIQHTLKEPTLLMSARRPGQLPIDYAFDQEKINRVDRHNGRAITTLYNSDGKVASQNAPVGPDGQMHPIGRYIYHTQATEVYDAEEHKTLYRFNEQILSIETYQNQTLYRIDRFTWDSTNGNLLKKTIEDSQGNLHHITQYTYDKNHNPIEEKTGDGTNWHTIRRTYSNDGFNLKLTESERPDRTNHYRYIPGTDLLKAELLYEGNTIRKRTFHFYDDCAICIKTIQDDGISEDPDDLRNLTYRTIQEIQPKQSTPCFGLPEVIQEKTIDTSGQEILLKKVIYTYTPFGKISKEDHYDSHHTYRYSLIHEYDANERLISKTDPLGHRTSFTYDENHNLTSISGPRADQHKEITYDKANRPIRITDWQTDGSTLITEKKYNKLGQVIAEIDACGNTTRFEYDSLGRCVATIHPDGATEKREYNILGHLTKETDPLGYETQKTYNYKGQPLSIHYPDGSKKQYTYFPHGPISSHRDKNGCIIHSTYDIFDHPIKSEIYSSQGILLKTTTVQYSAFCKLSETDGRGTPTLYTYDFAGRKVAEQKEMQKRSFTYDSLGLIEKTQEGDLAWIEHHDLLGQIIEKRTEKNGILQFQERYTYDPAGNRTQTINSQGIQETTYNTYGKPLTSKDPLGHVTHFDYTYQTTLTETTTNPHQIQILQIYDSRGRKSKLLKKNRKGETIQQSQNTFDLNGNLTDLTHTIFDRTTPIQTVSHHWDYGPMGRIERLLEAGVKQTQYVYDPKGRLKTIIKPNGDQLNHEYDDLGRLSRYFARDFDDHYEYDLNDCVLSVYDSMTQKKIKRIYDSFNNIIQEDLASGLSFSSTFDSQSRRTVFTLPDSSTITYSYEGVYLHHIQRSGIKHTYAKRNLEGQLLRMTGSLGEVSLERDALGRLKKIFSSFYTSELTYDPVGNLTQNIFQDSLGKEKRVYQFDDLDQLISEEEHTYHFDSLYNRLKKDTLLHTVNTLCQVIHDGQRSYDFDANGNLISDGIRKFVYDSQDRLMTVEENEKRIEYAYDPFHRRLWKKIFIKGKQTQYDRYLWDGDNEIGVVDEKGKIQELRILGEGLGAEIGGAVLYELRGKTYVPLHDHQGCVAALIDMASKKTECYRYTAYGEELTGGKLSPWRFSGKRVDDTGFIFFGRRYYYPELGRWITQDPEGFEHGPNLYAYVSNCPLTHLDLYGLAMVAAPTLNFMDHFNQFFSGDFEKSFWNKSCSYDLSILQRPNLPQGQIFFGNGMLNTLGEASLSLMHISDLAGGNNMSGLYNATHGLMDIEEAALGLFGLRTNPSTLFRNEWKAKLDRLPPDQFALHFCHSHSAIYTKHALEDSPEEIRKRIRVVAIAPATYIPRNICHSVQHYEAHLWRDPIPWFNPVGRWKNRHTIKVLPSHPDASLHDHSFRSPTFEQVISEEIIRYRKDLGK